MVSDQVDRDEKVEGLIEAMAKSCSFVQQVDFIKERSSRFVTVTKKILQQVVQCTYFVKEYYKNKSFGGFSVIIHAGFSDLYACYRSQSFQKHRDGS